MVSKKGLKKFNISNKLAYTLIVILSIVLIGVGVYALSPGITPNPGHIIGEVALPSCSNGQVLGMVSGSWDCITSPTTDSRFAITNNRLCFDAPSGCSDAQVYCWENKYPQPIYYGSDCSSLEKTYLDEMCYGVCTESGPACDGTDDTSNCAGGTQVYWTASGYCASQYYIECSCHAEGYYTEEAYIPAGNRCI
jgi:hypothetical protein